MVRKLTVKEIKYKKERTHIGLMERDKLLILTVKGVDSHEVMLPCLSQVVSAIHIITFSPVYRTTKSFCLSKHVCNKGTERWGALFHTPAAKESIIHLHIPDRSILKVFNISD